MTAGELAVLMAAVLCAIGFAALVVVLLRVQDSLRDVRSEVQALRAETRPLIDDLRRSTDAARAVVDEARDDLDRFDRVLGSAEAISGAVAGGSRVARAALSAPVIKTTALATGTKRAVRRWRGRRAS
jgi:Lon protease-like protein